jgi:hypothetical protein
MSITMYAYAESSADESDPDELFDITTDDANGWQAHFPNATLKFQHRDGENYVYTVFDGDDEIATLYASADIMPKRSKKAPANELTTRDMAERLGTDPKTLRMFLRASSLGVGSGTRYSFVAKDVAPLKAKFTKWLTEREAAKAEKLAKAG